GGEFTLVFLTPADTCSASPEGCIVNGYAFTSCDRYRVVGPAIVLILAGTFRNFLPRPRVQGFDNVTHDDAPLIQATLRGDSQAYGKLVQKYQDRLLTALVHICSSRHEAEDALQDAF